MSKIILLGLNELNFDYIKYYIKKGHLNNFKYIFDEYGYQETTSENEYKLLEPWIQWVTVTTGKDYKDHQVFRLGDIVNRPDLKQIFEIVEEKGCKVGGVSSFNVDNRLTNASFFVPDPWTQTSTSGSWLLRKLGTAVSQTVNDNAKGKVSKFSLIYIFLSLFFYSKLNNIPSYFKILLNVKKKGSKAVILDKLLGDVFIHQWKRSRPDFSNLFLNTGAHFQHHYMFNSEAYDGGLKNPEWYCPSDEDPLFMILKEYDKIIGRLLELDARLLIATGLHQKPHKYNTFYWRLRNHEKFFKEELNYFDFEKITPRMSRDFLIDFIDEKDALKCQNKLESIVSKKDNINIFTVDNRGSSLFVELTYANDIEENFEILSPDGFQVKDFKEHIAFVAIKNGEHHNIGYYLDTKQKGVEKNQIELKQIFQILENSF